MILKQKVRALKIESIRLQGDAFKMQHEYERRVDEVKLAKNGPTVANEGNESGKTDMNE